MLRDLSGKIMTRPSKNRSLDIWMNGELVGYWTITTQGKHEFRYAESWKDSKSVRPISLSMTLQASNVPHSGEVVENYFDNLLPDSPDIRKRIQSRFRTGTTSAFDLLNEIGRECVGAIQFAESGRNPGDIKKIGVTPLGKGGVAKILRSTISDTALGIENDDKFRISIAGAQEKTGLLLDKGKWYCPKGTTPSTHIFKLPLGKVTNINIDLSTSIENEWLCLEILKAYGLETAEAKIKRFGDQKALVVERFDRKLSSDSKWWIRLPMEDMCQVHGIASGHKYEVDGGPGIEKIMKLLLGSIKSFKDRRTFFKAQIIYWMLCATDGHAKNYSVFIENKGRYNLTPLYDVISAHPILGHGRNLLPIQRAKMAMAILGKNKHYKWSYILRRHWISTAKKCGFGKEINDLLNEIINLTPIVIKNVTKILPKSFPDSVSKPILIGLYKAKDKLE